MSGAIWLLRRDARPLLVVFVVFGSLYAVIAQFERVFETSDILSIVSLGVLPAPILLGTVTVLALSDGTPLRVTDAVRFALSRYFGLLFAYILTMVGTLVGFVLFLVPGLLLTAFWIVTIPILLREEKGPIAAMGQSFQRVKSEFWPIVSLTLLYLVGFIILISVSSLVLRQAIGQAALYAALTEIIQNVGFGILGAYFSAAIYLELSYSDNPDVSVFD